MGAFLGALWTFVNSTAGQSLLILVFGEVFRRTVKSKARRTKLLEYAAQAFAVAEAIGAHDKLGGKDKYLRFVEAIVTKLAAEKEAPLSAAEMELLKSIATEKAWLAKSKPKPPKPHG